ncbi:type I-E CRISPR-associated endonuclease Cas1e [Synergistes jonesii]|uniref:type I-E CRISPR-associated endonuclease Cas1e n=1 Tax=Synergistes jonesii TaxID=2754 RepID=UPI00242FD4E7|nr:type I-E CRISPR-associated endonuclease Cas1e [Synergistes jonesii]
MPKDLHILPKLRDSLTFIYVERAIIEQDNLSIVRITKEGRAPIPIAAMTVLMIGPGVSITHAAIKAVCDNGCMIIWCGEHASRFYAAGMGETRSAANLMHQATLCMNQQRHMEVVRRMYLRRFPKMTCGDMTLQQLRGMEGIRMREAYRLASKTSGIKWIKRDYKQTDWDAADPINRALSMANAILYSLCQAAVISLGYSPGLGFIHTGKMLSFVYDIADLYKAETTIPAAFTAVRNMTEPGELGRQVRLACRDAFRASQILKRIPQDIDWVLQTESPSEDTEAKNIGNLWNDNDGGVADGGVNYAGVPLDDTDNDGKCI